MSSDTEPPQACPHLTLQRHRAHAVWSQLFLGIALPVSQGQGHWSEPPGLEAGRERAGPQDRYVRAVARAQRLRRGSSSGTRVQV